MGFRLADYTLNRIRSWHSWGAGGCIFFTEALAEFQHDQLNAR